MRQIINQSIAILLITIGSFCQSPVQARVIMQGIYQCPMKCEGDKEYLQPGPCPVCEMQMIEVQSCNSVTEENVVTTNGCVNFSGAMRDVMHNGQLAGTISIDSIDTKMHLYGIGPLEYLKGEILISDGRSFVSTVSADGKVNVKESYDVKAPFFVYANTSRWNQTKLPDSITTMKQLESYLDDATKFNTRPFCFRVNAEVEIADIHIVNLPDNAKVQSPEDAHKNQKNIKIKNTIVEVIGFFSTEHSGIFTHHDSFIHAHLITLDKSVMGHCDKIKFKKGTARLFLPD